MFIIFREYAHSGCSSGCVKNNEPNFDFFPHIDSCSVVLVHTAMLSCGWQSMKDEVRHV